MVVVVDGIQEFDLLSQRIHPAASRVEMLAQGDAGRRFVAFDLLAEGDELLLELPYTERRERLAAVVGEPVAAHPGDRRPRRRRAWLTGRSRGRGGEGGGRALPAGRAHRAW